MLNVSNIENSLEFYQKALGFNVVSDPAAASDWRWATIRSGNTELMLSETGRRPIEPEIGDPHVDTKHVIAQGYKPTPLEVTAYRMREFSLIDPDGHVLSCGQYAGQ
jgi:catechol 2,3-dioxygenase-like lactoylglutathione lyase family enzyme